MLIIFGSMRCPDPRFVWPNNKVIAVPCGKCLACLSNRRTDWAFRLMQEYKVSDSALFVTLTYNEKFVPEHGVVKRHLQLYFKRLRKLCPKLRYYAVGEYGLKTLRPHYHAIIFNVDEKSVRHSWAFHGKFGSRPVPIGLVHVGRCTEASVQYVLKYLVQSKEEIPKGLNPSFAIMSRGHGLGAHYLSDAMIKWHRADDRVYTLRYGEKGRLARFYKDKIWPDSTWSDWAYRRQQLNKKALLEAEAREEKNNAELKKKGYSPEKIQSMRNAEISRIKQKVAFTQKL